jgi:hypothetical protein
MGNIISTRPKPPEDALYSLGDVTRQTNVGVCAYVTRQNLHHLCRDYLIQGNQWKRPSSFDTTFLNIHDHPTPFSPFNPLTLNSLLGHLLPSLEADLYEKLSEKERSTIRALLLCSEREIANPILSMQPLNQRMVTFLTPLSPLGKAERASVRSIAQSIYHFMLIENQMFLLDQIPKIKGTIIAVFPMPKTDALPHGIATLITEYALTNLYPFSPKELSLLLKFLKARANRLTKKTCPLIAAYNWTFDMQHALLANVAAITTLAQQTLTPLKP